MKRVVLFAALALTACPPQLDPHGTVCNVDADCATGLFCAAHVCGDVRADAGTGGGSGGGQATGGGSATGGGGSATGGGGPLLQPMTVTASPGDAGPCSSGDGTESRRPDGGRAECGDTPFCLEDGGAVALPWQPTLVAIGPLVGEPLRDLVLVEGTRLHVLENLGGMKFVERTPTPPVTTTELGVNPRRLSTACLSVVDTQRTVFVSGQPVDGGTRGLDGGYTRDGGNEVLMRCVVAGQPQACTPFYTDVVDYTNAAVDDGGFDALVIGVSTTMHVFAGNLMEPYTGSFPGYPVEALGDLFFPPTQSFVYYSGFGGSQVMTFIAADGSSLQGVQTNNDISNVGLKLARLGDQEAVVAFYTGHTIPDGIQLFDVDESGNLNLPGEISPGTVEVRRMTSGDFSSDGGLSRAALITVEPGGVRRWPLYSKSPAELGLQPAEMVYPADAADIALGDLDGDGVNDLAIVTADQKLVILKGR